MLCPLFYRDPGVQHTSQGQFEHGDMCWASSVRVHKEFFGELWAGSELAADCSAHMCPLQRTFWTSAQGKFHRKVPRKGEAEG